MRIQGIMSTPVVSCGPEDRLQRAAQLMWENECGTVAVVGAEERLVGILTDRDIAMAACRTGRPLSEIDVADVMARQVVTCEPTETVDDVEHLMRDRQLGRVIVVDRLCRPVGVVSLGDIARYALSSQRREAIERQVVLALAAIRSPRRRTTRPPPM